MARSKDPRNRKLRLDLAPGKDFWVVPALVVLEILVFLAMVVMGASALSPGAITLFEWGGNQRTAVLDGEFWRFFTALFIHDGAFHLLVNLFSIWLAGRILEPLLGSLNTFLLILLCGLTSSLGSFMGNPVLISVGASGIGYGMISATFLALFVRASYFRELVPHVLLLLILFVLQVVFGTFNDHLDRSAHWGGSVAGALFMLLFGLHFNTWTNMRQTRALVGVLFIALVTMAWYTARDLKNPLGEYRQALRVFRVESDSAEQAYLRLYDTLAFREGMEHWDRAAAAFDHLDRSSTPPVLLEEVSRIQLYCQLRKKEFSLRIDYLRQDGTFAPEIYRSLRQQIDMLESGKPVRVLF